MGIRWKTCCVIGVATLVGVFCDSHRLVNAQPKAAGDAQALVKRGDYLVNQVARCGDCHTPRDAKGRLDMTRHLRGARMWFTPNDRAKEWSDKAPDITIAGKARNWTDDRMLKFLSTGK